MVFYEIIQTFKKRDVEHSISEKYWKLTYTKEKVIEKAPEETEEFKE